MIKVAILGFGTVGSGVAEVLDLNKKLIEKRTRETVELKYVLDLRDFPDSPYADKVIHDFSVIENDPEVSIVVETMGGIRAAKEFSEKALKAGKSVITSNKELVAQYGFELLQLAKENNVSYLFEASVGGGIPIIRPLTSCLEANEITDICGILNGTSNYILTKMIKQGTSFEEALKDAQALGYAEADPTADVEGHDSCRKICILASLAFGHHIYPNQVPTCGITKITMADVAYADSCGRKIRLLGRAIKFKNDQVCIYVEPHLLDGTEPLATVEDVFNAIYVSGNAVGDVMFYGRGAGKLPTASAVVADIIDAIKHIGQRKYVSWDASMENQVASTDNLKDKFYLRMRASAEQVLRLFGEVQFLARSGAPEGEVAFLTSVMTKPELIKILGELTPESCIRVYH